jgi:hypothetical protein
MANLNVKDGANASKYLKSTGAGTDGDPYIPEHLVTGPLTDAQLRASDVKVSLDSEVVTVSGVIVTGGLTDTQLRASDVKVSLDNELVTVSGVTSLLPGTYLGQQVLSFVSATNQNATLPSNTKAIWITAEGGKVYAAINTTAAPTSAGVYVSDGNARFTGSYNGITSLGVYAASGVYAHLIYES